MTGTSKGEPKVAWQAAGCEHGCFQLCFEKTQLVLNLKKKKNKTVFKMVTGDILHGVRN